MFKTLMAAAMFASTSAVVPGTDASENTLKEMIKRSVIYPAHLESTSEAEIVLVRFVAEPCGSLRVEEINSSNPAFGAYVAEKIEGQRVEPAMATGEPVLMKFRFVRE